jgi:hypothetical protein
MDIVVLAVTVIAALLLDRGRALAVAAAAWVFGLSMVAWGPAHNSSVHLHAVGFWAPWIVVLAICGGLVLGIQALKRRWSSPRSSQSVV